MNPKRLKKVYFLGIGGIGMSALARFFNREGVEVHGYDLTKTKLTKKLEAEGMTIHYKESLKKIPKIIDLVVVTPAIPSDHKELQWFQKKGFLILKRAEVLGMISQGMKAIAVAGTHGKTTTCSIITHILKDSGMKTTAFLGGILAKEKTNFIYGDSKYVIIEADEYDRSFLHLHPKILVITAMDADHLDIYGSVEEMYDAYRQLTLQIKKGGTLILGAGVHRHFDEEWRLQLEKRKIKVVRHLEEFDFKNVSIANTKYRFDAQIGEKSIKNLTSNLPGLHNVSNSLAACYVAKKVGVKKKKIRAALKKFKGISRRFELVHDGKKVLIDDYAHHPEELKHTIKTVKSIYSDRKVLGIFQPHLYSRTQDFYKGFAKELSGLDGVILLPIYPAREQPMKGVKSEMIYNLITLEDKYLVKESKLLKHVEKLKEYDVIITLGASDLDKYHKGIIKLIK